MKFRLIPVILTAALTSVLTLVIAAHYQRQFPVFAGNNANSLPVRFTSFGSNTPTGGGGPVSFENAAEASVKAVVHIKTTTKARTVVAPVQDPFGGVFGDIFGKQQYYIPSQSGSGSGVVISNDGYIVTNNHVVADANEVTVTFNDRYTTQAKVVGTDPSTDIAVLKVNEKNLPYMDFGNSDDVRLGQWVLAVGYPLSLDATVTAGIVSAKGRNIGINHQNSAIEAYIQTDAAVNPGNSGGALVNTSGQLIGINSAIASPTGSYAGYSYAVPSNIVKKAVNDLIKYGSVQRAYMGVEFVDSKKLSNDQISSLGIDKTEGVYVGGIVPNMGAAKAGLQKGDFITQVNGVNVSTEPQLLEQIARYQPGDNVSVTYLRNGSTHTTTVELKNIEGTTGIVKHNDAARLLGANFKALSGAEASKYGVDGGVVVTDIGRGVLASQTSIKKGFVITGINDNEVNSVDDLQKALAEVNGRVQIAGFYPGAQGMYYYGINNIDNNGSEQ